METFEYKRDRFDAAHDKGTVTEWLNRYGEMGWELVTIIKDQQFLLYDCFFKRKIKF